MKLKRLFKALFQRRQQDVLGHYIENMQTIIKLVSNDMIYVDVTKPYVTISLDLHLAYIDDEVKLATFPYSLMLRLGLVERDRHYRALMKNIIAYINLNRARLGLALFPSTQRLDFLVMNMEKTKPLLVGYYQSGELDYKLIEEKESPNSGAFLIGISSKQNSLNFPGSHHCFPQAPPPSRSLYNDKPLLFHIGYT